MKVLIHFWREPLQLADKMCPSGCILIGCMCAHMRGAGGQTVQLARRRAAPLFQKQPTVLVELFILLPARYIGIIDKIMAAQLHSPALWIEFSLRNQLHVTKAQCSVLPAGHSNCNIASLSKQPKHHFMANFNLNQFSNSLNKWKVNFQRRKISENGKCFASSWHWKHLCQLQIVQLETARGPGEPQKVHEMLWGGLLWEGVPGGALAQSA